MAGSDDDIPPPPPPPQTQTPTQQAPHTISTIKLPILKKGEYDIWAMKWKLFAHTTILSGKLFKEVLPPKTAEEILARERERKARTTLLMALPEVHLAKFHKMNDAKEMWETIKSRFGENDESKKMQKFQSLLCQLEIHGACVSTEDANHKFIRSKGKSRIVGRRDAWKHLGNKVYKKMGGEINGKQEDFKALGLLMMKVLFGPVTQKLNNENYLLMALQSSEGQLGDASIELQGILLKPLKKS
ncbi:hypothetical protein Tco_0287516 [Tanacetum coccineum]